MAESITYNLLWEALQKERASNSLQLLQKGFYEDVKEFITQEKEKKNKTEEEAAQIANVERLVNEIFEKRKQKIVLYVAYKKPLPNPIPEIELDMYKKINDLFNNTKLFESSEQKTSTNKLRVTIEKLPEVFLPSGTKIGPLEKGQIIEINDKNDAQFLIDNSLCVYEKL